MARGRNDPEREARAALRSLDRALWLTRAGLVAERAARAFWPVWTLALAALAAFGAGALEIGAGSRLLPYLGGGLAGALVFGLLHGVRRFRWPSRAAARDRLDRSLPGQPITALSDRPAVGAGDAASMAVWRAHLAAMARRVAGARPVSPDLRLAARDPLALRYAALTALIVAAIWGTGWRGERLGEMAAGPGGAAIATGPAYEGWIQPPAYTGRPTIYLNEAEDRAELTVPEGSEVALRLYGALGATRVEESVSGAPVGEADRTAPVQAFTITQDGRLALTGADERAWQIVTVPDAPPEIETVDGVGSGLRGGMTLKFEASDDYGVQSGEVVISLDLDAVDRRHGLTVEPEPRAPVVLDLPMPFAGDRTAFEDKLTGDLSEHPWAGLPVVIEMRVEDAAGQTGAAEPLSVALPGRRFFEPLAAALAEQRRDLLWSRENGRRVAQVLRAVTYRPEEVFDSSRAYLVTRFAIRRLEAGLPGGLDAALRDEVAEMLWKAALLIEEGDLSDALARLRRAQDRLAEALEQGASDEEIAELMDDLREAMRDYMEQMAREMLENPDQQMSENQPQGQQVTQQDLQQMLDRIEELSRQGRMDEAQQLLDQLRQMMENMRMTRGNPQQGQGQQAMQGLQDTLRQQQGLSDEAFRQLQEQFNGGAQSGESDENEGYSGGRGRGESHEGQGGRGGGPDDRPGPGELADRQNALRELLRQQQGNLPGAGTPEGDAARDAIDRAGRAMEEAGEHLEDGAMRDALDDQAEAMQALREGIRELGEALANQQQPGQGQQGNQFSDAPPDQRSDPLGRRAGNTGQIGSEENMLPGDDVFRRSRELMEEIRRRSGDRTRPEIELDYLERLLDRF